MTEEATKWNVQLTYFKRSGKCYSGGSYTSHKKEIFEVWAEVRAMMEAKKLPGLVSGTVFDVLVGVPGHPNEHPILLRAFRCEHEVSDLKPIDQVIPQGDKRLDFFDHVVGPSIEPSQKVGFWGEGE